jgi:hypothetical protein
LHGAGTQADHLGGLENAGPLGKFAAGGFDLLRIGVGTAEALANILPALDLKWPSRAIASLARARPALTRATIISRSNSEKMPSMPNIALPAGVVVSTD